MKRRNLISKTTIYIYLVLVIVFSSCSSNTNTPNISVDGTITRIEISNFKEEGKYWVITETYNFYTDEQYMVGDSLIINKR